MRYVWDLDEDSGGGKELLGGKGAGLAEMTALELPVPAGFVVTTDACRYFMAEQRFPDGLEDEIEQHVASLERKAGKTFGDTRDPLLVSVRSGAAVSMPGMMDTILNLGLNDEAVEGLAETTGNPRFAYDCFRRLIQMYGEVVEGLDAHAFEAALDDLKRDRGVKTDAELTADDLKELTATFLMLYEQGKGERFPQDPRHQLLRSVGAVFESWNNPRANVYRRSQGIPDTLGTAVNVIAMVFGNRGENCATGVCFTRDPSTGEHGIYGEFLRNAQGEDVVAGIRTPQPLPKMQEDFPEAYQGLLDVMSKLERHYKD
ncbi:MAG: PEP/pyruvate-binding domain-containing protein, partial [Gaiellaceae bacterium]